MQAFPSKMDMSHTLSFSKILGRKNHRKIAVSQPFWLKKTGKQFNLWISVLLTCFFAYRCFDRKKEVKEWA